MSGRRCSADSQAPRRVVRLRGSRSRPTAAQLLGREVAGSRCCEDRQVMNPRAERAPRRRCCECRCWYQPARSTAQTQVTCGKKCRLRRRGRQEQRRRRADLPAAREIERDRQRRHRERDSTLVHAPSRAGLTAEGAEAIEVIVEKLRHEQRLSRAGLRRQLRRLSLGEPASIGAETGT
jgi:hypothetical protein